MEKKYKNVVPTPEEERAFNEDLDALCKKHSLNIQIVPQFKANVENKAYEITGVLFLQKVVEEVEAEIVADSTMSPIQKDDLAQS